MLLETKMDLLEHEKERTWEEIESAKKIWRAIVSFMMNNSYLNKGQLDIKQNAHFL